MQQCNFHLLVTNLNPVSSFILNLHLQEIPGPFFCVEAQSKTLSTAEAQRRAQLAEAANTQQFAQQFLGFASRSSRNFWELFGGLSVAAAAAAAGEVFLQPTLPASKI